MLNSRTISFMKCTSRILFTSSYTSIVRCNSNKSTIIQEEVDKFNQHAKLWWDVTGPVGALHTLNTLRVPFARDGLLNSRHVPLEACSGPHPLKGYKYVDVGCGAGIYSEALARIGANVTGIDASKELIQVASQHASLDESLTGNISYLNTTVEEHVTENAGQYDAVVCSEVVEHVEDPSFFVENCVKLVKPGGSLFFTTINQNWLAGFFMIFMAERVFGVIPKGTHQYRLLMPPKKLEQMLKSNGCHIVKVHGSLALPSGQWMWVSSTVLSYAMHAMKKIV